MRLPAWLRLIAHRRGWIASPALSFRDVPFGPDNRNLAVEVMRDLAHRHTYPCTICHPDATDAPTRP